MINPIQEEIRWYKRGTGEENLSAAQPSKHVFAHWLVRSKLDLALAALGCDDTASILDVGCGSGSEAMSVHKVSRRLIGVDVANDALKAFVARGAQGVLADAARLPIRTNAFDFVLSSGLLHHLVGQGDLGQYVKELARVTKPGGYVIALEPNILNPSGFLMNVFNTITPGITGLVPHERALCPLSLGKTFRSNGLSEVKCIAASYAWNRFPLWVSKLISRHEERIRFRKPFNLFGWFEIVYGRKVDSQRR